MSIAVHRCEVSQSIHVQSSPWCEVSQSIHVHSSPWVVSVSQSIHIHSSPWVLSVSQSIHVHSSPWVGLWQSVSQSLSIPVDGLCQSINPCHVQSMGYGRQSVSPCPVHGLWKSVNQSKSIHGLWQIVNLSTNPCTTTRYSNRVSQNRTALRKCQSVSQSMNFNWLITTDTKTAKQFIAAVVDGFCCCRLRQCWCTRHRLICCCL